MGKKPLFDLFGKTAIITGSGRGLGRAMAYALASAGSNVVIVDIDAASAKKTAGGIQDKYKVKTIFLTVDVSSEGQISGMVKDTLKVFSRVDILVNNAGIHVGGDFPPEELDRKFWDRTMAVNLTGPFLCARLIGREMIKQKRGKIINIASISGLVVNRLTGRHPISYCVSKAGVIMMTKALAVEWAKYNINVNAIAPTYFKTAIINPDPKIQNEMIRDIPMGRLGNPDDLAGTVIYLASGASDFVTGHTLLVDGGYTGW